MSRSETSATTESLRPAVLTGGSLYSKALVLALLIVALTTGILAVPWWMEQAKRVDEERLHRARLRAEHLLEDVEGLSSHERRTRVEALAADPDLAIAALFDGPRLVASFVRDADADRKSVV